MSCHDKFERFRFFVLPTNVSGNVNIALSSTPVSLASLTIGADRDDAVFLTVTIGWRDTSLVQAGNGILFKIWRDVILLFSIYQSLNGGNEAMIATFNHVDSVFNEARHFNYYITAELPVSGTNATVIGSITFTASLINK